MVADRIGEQLRTQAGWCRRLGSPLYAHLLERAAADASEGGPVAALLDGHEHDSSGSALALRFAGALHRLVLEGRAPSLARHYPSVGGVVGDLDAAWRDFRETLIREDAAVRPLLERGVQTNEVGRSASLLGGFLLAARDTSLPLRILEVGASAGLNLRWDHYRFEWRGAGCGPANSPVRFLEPFVDEAPPLVPDVPIVERRGCDASPVDPANEEGRLTLLSYVWPDQAERFARLRGALDVAGRVPATVDRADAAAWLVDRLTAPATGVATVVFHSIVLQYLGREGTVRLREIIAAAGARATLAAPLFWLRLEPERGDDGEWVYPVRMTSWPGGEDRRLAVSSPHGPPVLWLG